MRAACTFFLIIVADVADSCSDLSKRLNLSPEDGEKWIVNLIRDSKMGIDAKIDLQAVSRERVMKTI